MYGKEDILKGADSIKILENQERTKQEAKERLTEGIVHEYMDEK